MSITAIPQTAISKLLNLFNRPVIVEKTNVITEGSIVDVYALTPDEISAIGVVKSFGFSPFHTDFELRAYVVGTHKLLVNGRIIRTKFADWFSEGEIELR